MEGLWQVLTNWNIPRWGNTCLWQINWRTEQQSFLGRPPLAELSITQHVMTLCNFRSYWKGSSGAVNRKCTSINVCSILCRLQQCIYDKLLLSEFWTVHWFFFWWLESQIFIKQYSKLLVVIFYIEIVTD